jgi:CrcB protein
MIWYVALGSALGGVSRYLLGGWIQTRTWTTFPIQTLLINLSGSFLLGFLQTYALDTAAITPGIRAMLTIGFCGGYTTFSTFSFETVRMLEDGDWRRAGLYMGLSLVLCVIGAIAGVMLAREFIALKHQ